MIVFVSVCVVSASILLFFFPLFSLKTVVGAAFDRGMMVQQVIVVRLVLLCGRWRRKLIDASEMRNGLNSFAWFCIRALCLSMGVGVMVEA